MSERTPSNGTGWQKPAIGALWGVLMLFATWIWASNNDAKRETTAKQAATDALVRQGQERLATLEEADRNTRDALRRIEEGVNELRRERRR